MHVPGCSCSNPDPDAERKMIEFDSSDKLVPALVAFMNMVFAFGGQVGSHSVDMCYLLVAMFCSVISCYLNTPVRLA